jgi:hypothetical protein
MSQELADAIWAKGCIFTHVRMLSSVLKVISIDTIAFWQKKTI